jgi:hypothetical protein
MNRPRNWNETMAALVAFKLTPARERFPHMEHLENGINSRVAEQEATEALDLIDRQAVEIARLNAALIGESDT